MDRALRPLDSYYDALVIKCGSVNPPWPLFDARAEASGNWVLADVIGLSRKLLTAFIIAEPMIKITFLPNDGIAVPMKMFPIADDATHRVVSLEGQESVDVIRH